MITIKDVAKKAGVSISTASYALNNQKNVSEKTKKKVLEAAKELNYHPNFSARNLRSKKTRNIGFFIYGFEGPIFGDILEGFNVEIRRNNYNTIVSSGESSNVFLKDKQVDAAIIFDVKLDTDTIINYAKDNLVILLDRTIEGKNIYVSKIDNEESVTNLLESTLNNNYKRIAYLSGPKKTPSNEERYEAFKKYLDNNNLTLFKEYKGNFTLSSGYEIGLKIAESEVKPDFIFAANDESAIGLINALTKKGIKVPGDISVVGFDGILLGDYISPKLSTVKVEYKKWGDDLAKFVLGYLNEEAEVLKVKNPKYEIVLKGSTK